MSVNMVAMSKTAVKPLEAKIKFNEKEVEKYKTEIENTCDAKVLALQKFKEKMSAYTNALSKLTTAIPDDNLLCKVKADISTTETGDNKDETYLSVTSASYTKGDSLEVNVERLAKPSGVILEKSATGGFPFTNAGVSGTLRLNIGGVDVDTEIAAGDSVSDIVSKINNTLSNGSYNFKATYYKDTLNNTAIIDIRALTNETRNISYVSVPMITTSDINQQSRNDFETARINVTNVGAIESNNNSFKDVKNGISLDIKKANSAIGEKQTIKIVDDGELFKNGLADLSKSFNELTEFIVTQKNRIPDDKESLKNTPLYGMNALNLAELALQKLTSTVNGKSLASLVGIGLGDATYIEGGPTSGVQLLEVKNIQTYENAMSKLEELKSFFANSAAITHANPVKLSYISHDAVLGLQNDNQEFILHIDTDNVGAPTLAKATLTLAAGGTNELTGTIKATGDDFYIDFSNESELKGMRFKFSHLGQVNGSYDFNVTPTQGVAFKAEMTGYGVLSKYGITGLIPNELQNTIDARKVKQEKIESLEKEITKYQAEIDKLTFQMEQMQYEIDMFSDFLDEMFSNDKK